MVVQTLQTEWKCFGIAAVWQERAWRVVISYYKQSQSFQKWIKCNLRTIYLPFISFYIRRLFHSVTTLTAGKYQFPFQLRSGLVYSNLLLLTVLFSLIFLLSFLSHVNLTLKIFWCCILAFFSSYWCLTVTQQ